MTDAMLFARPCFQVKAPTPKLPSLDASYMIEDPRNARSSISTRSSTSNGSYTAGVTRTPSTSTSKFGSISRSLSTSQPGYHDRRNTVYSTYSTYSTSEPISSVEPIWWDNQRIGETVTQKFLEEKIPDIQGAGLRQKLLQPVAFGDGLTENTYAEWIVERAPCFFLILLQMGIPEQIFGVVDISWDDDDLPIPMDQVSRLKLTYPPDPSVDRRFYKKQHYFILKDLSRGSHVDFADDDVVPLDIEQQRLMTAFSRFPEDHVSLPRGHGDILRRTKIPLNSTLGPAGIDAFARATEPIRSLSHPHISQTIASYTHQGSGYVLQAPACDNTLRGFLNSPPHNFKQTPRKQRRQQLLTWCHCLADAVKYLSDKGISNTNMNSKSIHLDGDNIYISDLSYLDTDQDKLIGANDNAERHEYAAPELYDQDLSILETPPSPESPIRQMSVFKTPLPGTVMSHRSSPQSSISTVRPRRSISPARSSTSTTRNDSRADSKAAVFTLGCIMLEMWTIYFKHKSSAFASHRGQRKWRIGRNQNAHDASFQANLPQVYSWIDTLEREASNSKHSEDQIIKQVMTLCREMLQLEPVERLDIDEVQARLSEIMKEEGLLCHCGDMNAFSDRPSTSASAPRWEWPWDAQTSPKSLSVPYSVPGKII